MRKHIAIILIIILTLSLTACAETGKPNNNSSREKNQKDEGDILSDNLEDEEENQIVEPTPETEEKKVSLYFANPRYIETGDESLEHFIVQEKSIKYGNVSIEESIVRELMKMPDDSAVVTAIPSTIKLLGVEVASGTAFVNFAREGLYGGSLQESFTITQITKSLLELDNIDRVQFLVDGEKTETLMGHYEILHPFEQ